MSKYLMLLLATAALSLTACGKDSKKDGNGGDNRGQGGRVLNKGAYPNVAQTVFGQWKGPDEMDKGFLFKTNMFMNQTSVGIEIVCEKGFEKASASFSVNARITEDTIEILESAERSVKNGNITCKANISPIKFGYTVQGNFLRLSVENKGELNLTRIF